MFGASLLELTLAGFAENFSQSQQLGKKWLFFIISSLQVQCMG